LEVADVNDHIKPERGTDVDNHGKPNRKAVLKTYTASVRLISYQSDSKICMEKGRGPRPVAHACTYFPRSRR
jgi:hypothetical protein